MDGDDESHVRHVDKGKARARSPETTERTPLLPSSSRVDLDDLEPASHSRRSLAARLVRVFLITIAVCVALLLFLLLLAWSYAGRASHMSPEDLMARALVMRGPDRLTVINITQESGIWLRVKGRVGLDAGEVIGVNSPEDDNDNILKYFWKAWGRWGIAKLDSVSVNMSTISLASERHPEIFLATIDTQPIEVPLTTNPPKDLSWLSTFSMPVYILPTQNVSALTHFAMQSWRDGSISVKATVDRAEVRGGRGWRRNLKTVRSGIKTIVRQKLPALPGLPTPGHNNPFPAFSDLVTLRSFNLTSSDQTLNVTAEATAINPVPESIDFTAPSLPFIISLPSISNRTSTPVPVAAVTSAPFTLSRPNITLHATGSVLPIPANASATFSAFLGRYLSALPNPIIISTDLFPSYTLDAVFPAPNPKPQILRDVTIRDMKVKPSGPGGAFLASGTVYAKIVMPRGMNVKVDVERVLPDVLIYDGPVPPTISPAPSPTTEPVQDDPPPPPPPLPEPIPERAFGRVRPDDWLDAISVPLESDDGEGSAVAVSAKIVDVPLEVLPGREREFSDFIGKVVFGSHGAVAGLQGVVAVSVNVRGLPVKNGTGGGIELDGLPFHGAVRIGKKGL
ncbi:hypothetical protein PUNSTDRAFT_57626 [Punctularia strigosozonata HHB-11173 SS5]|uniref:uncharacterized protein n=1 Tax=Punctularia strigosozonata (strain HHB-11173) TaxID=741275 RepID=UPI00044175B7|nr:uncharacterized protein PUNSTDRAFT_57626 [Punctularia strigosozonata HHB-11173 SS5]EIN14709.1 hypothetical protein PUNSTDRAFT_57626 [Punctularia strigosozonata HHB-11173 SS5]